MKGLRPMSDGISNKHISLFKQPVKVSIYDAGSCRQFEKITIRDGVWRSVSIPALFACIEHPKFGPVLFDTGYSSHFFKASNRLPYAMYRWVTPVEWTEEKRAEYQLRQAGIDPSNIQYVILSHFHADHIGGIRDFPQAKFIYLQSAYDSVKHRKGFSALRAAFYLICCQVILSSVLYPLMKRSLFPCLPATLSNVGWMCLGMGA